MRYMAKEINHNDPDVKKDNWGAYVKLEKTEYKGHVTKRVIYCNCSECKEQRTRRSF